MSNAFKAIRTMRPIELIRRLVDFVRDHGDVVRKGAGWQPSDGGACILMTKVGCDVLEEFGIEAEPFPVSMIVGNAAWVAWCEAGHAGDMPADAHSVGDMGLRGERAPGGLGGHLVIHLPRQHTLIDLDLGSWSRPLRGIALPPAGVLPWPAGTQEYAWDVGDVRVLMRARAELIRFRESSYWSIDTAAAVRAITEAMK